MATHRRLFEAPPAEFIGARNALARELRDAGKADEAKEVAAMRKPPATLWIANQLGPRHRAQAKALVEATRKLKKAQAGGSGDLRAAMQEQRESLQKLMEAVGPIAAEIEAHITPEAQRRIQTTVQTAAATEPDSLLEGTLAQELEATGFGELLGKAPPPAPAAQAPKQRERTRSQEAKPDKKAEAAARRARAEHARSLKKAEAEAKRLDQRARATESKTAAAQAAADRARKIAEQAQKVAAEARGRANEAAARALELRKTVSD